MEGWGWFKGGGFLEGRRPCKVCVHILVLTKLVREEEGGVGCMHTWCRGTYVFCVGFGLGRVCHNNCRSGTQIKLVQL